MRVQPLLQALREVLSACREKLLHMGIDIVALYDTGFMLSRHVPEKQ